MSNKMLKAIIALMCVIGIIVPTGCSSSHGSENTSVPDSGDDSLSYASVLDGESGSETDSSSPSASDSTDSSISSSEPENIKPSAPADSSEDAEDENSSDTVSDIHTHTFSEWKVTVVPTCVKEGEKCRICTECQEKETEVLPLSNHSYQDWKVTKAQTCTENGTRVRSCSVCGKTESESIPASGHKWGNPVVTKEATYESAGSQTRTCSSCGQTIKETIPMKVLTDADKYAMALKVAQEIANSIEPGGRDIDRVGQAAYIVSQYCAKCVYTTEGRDFVTAYGVFIKGEYTCAGATSALSMVLDCMGYENEHVNEGLWTHQWCRLEMDGEIGWADGQIGWVGYGSHPYEW